MAPSREIGVPEIAYRLGCSIPLAQSLVRTGRIPGRKVERGWVAPLEAVEEYLARHTRPHFARDQEQVA